MMKIAKNRYGPKQTFEVDFEPTSRCRHEDMFELLRGLSRGGALAPFITEGDVACSDCNASVNLGWKSLRCFCPSQPSQPERRSRTRWMSPTGLVQCIACGWSTDVLTIPRDERWFQTPVSQAQMTCAHTYVSRVALAAPRDLFVCRYCLLVLPHNLSCMHGTYGEYCASCCAPMGFPCPHVDVLALGPYLICLKCRERLATAKTCRHIQTEGGFCSYCKTDVYKGDLADLAREQSVRRDAPKDMQPRATPRRFMQLEEDQADD